METRLVGLAVSLDTSTRTPGTPDTLTPQEAQIARLAAGGRRAASATSR